MFWWKYPSRILQFAPRGQEHIFSGNEDLTAQMKWLFPLEAILNVTQTASLVKRTAGPNSALSRLAPSLGTEAAYLLNNERVRDVLICDKLVKGWAMGPCSMFSARRWHHQIGFSEVDMHTRTASRQKGEARAA